MNYEKELRHEPLIRNGYHLFVDVLDRVMREHNTKDMTEACHALWRYFTFYWPKITEDQNSKLNQVLVGLLGRRAEPSEIKVMKMWEHLELDHNTCLSPRSYNKELAVLPDDWQAYVEAMHNSNVRPSLPWGILFEGMGSVPPVNLRARRGHSIEATDEQKRWKECAEKMAKARDWHDCIVAQNDGLVAWGHDPVAELKRIRDLLSREGLAYHHLTAFNAHPLQAGNAHASSSANSLARISHYYAAKHYGLDGRRWEMQAQL